MEKPGEAVLGASRPRDHHAGKLGRKGALEPRAQRRLAAALLGATLLRKRKRGSEPHCTGNVLGAGAHAALLAATKDQRAQAHALPRPEDAHLLGAIDLGGGEGDHVGPKRGHVARE